MAKKKASAGTKKKSSHNKSIPCMPILGSEDGSRVGMESVPGMRLRCICRGHSDGIGRFVWSPCGEFIASPSSDKTIRIWEANAGTCVDIIEGLESEVSCLSWSGDAQLLVSGDAQGSVCVWDCASWTLTKRISIGSQLNGVSLSPDGEILATGDNTGQVRVFSRNTWAEICSFGSPEIRLGANPARILDVKWSPDGMTLAANTESRIVHFWSREDRSLLPELQMRLAHTIPYGLGWSVDGRSTLLSCNDNILRVFDSKTGAQIYALEGQNSIASSVSSAKDGRFVATKGTNEVVLWDAEQWGIAARLPEEGDNRWMRTVAFHPIDARVLATMGQKDSVIRIWDLDPTRYSRDKSVWHASAKIALVGESNVGKSCLAMRLAEDRYPEDDEMGTTHGMRFWSMDAEELHPAARPPRGELRDVVLWDFGGQDEYKLVHQLFLHDTTLALVLIDPTRGRAAMDEARDWNKQLDKHLLEDQAVKLLVGAKVDRKRELVDQGSINALCKECGFAAFLDLSAKTGRNTKKLRKLISDALDWNGMSKTSRPELFQHIRDNIETRRKKKQVVLTTKAFKQAIKKTAAMIYEEAAVDAVSEQLSTQGIIVRTQLTGGEEAFVLQLPVIERYAGSLIVMARSNGVPAIEERQLSSIKNAKLPGMLKKERLSPTKERMVMECIVELMIQHGICFRHAGMLVFPTLFPATGSEEETLPHSVSLYYDFTGAIDNIYASLVSQLMVGEGFGEGRLLPGRVEFEQSGQGICGIRHVKRRCGFAHIDMFFSETTSKPQRNLFIRFVEEHLREYGVDIREHQAIKCECGVEIEESIVQRRVRAGKRDIVCPVCEKKTLISDVANTIRERDRDSDERILALRKRIRVETSVDAEIAKGRVAGKRAIEVWKDKLAYLQAHEAIASDASKQLPLMQDIEEIERRIEELSLVKMTRPEREGFGKNRLLHLSDLHFTGRTSVRQHLVPLLQDIRNGEHLGFDSVEYLVISGDMTDKGDVAGFGKARDFVQKLIEELNLSARRCVFVPGNHDVHDIEDAWKYFLTQKAACEYGATEETWHKEGRVYVVEDRDEYKNRFRDFSNSFFHKVLGLQAYPLESAEQGISYLFEETGIQFLTLNSAWQIDQFNRDRSSIHPEAVLNAVAQADKLRSSAIDAGRLKKQQKILRIGVWHHALEGKWAMQKDDFLEHLQLANVKLCLHGDVHEMRLKHVREWDKGGVHIIGAGTFGAPESGRPESTPRLYNLIEFADDMSMVRVHTRKQKKQYGAWSGFHEWPDPDGGGGKVPYFCIELEG